MKKSENNKSGWQGAIILIEIKASLLQALHYWQNHCKIWKIITVNVHCLELLWIYSIDIINWVTIFYYDNFTLTEIKSITNLQYNTQNIIVSDKKLLLSEEHYKW
jgi:hypothetical protein